MKVAYFQYPTIYQESEHRQFYSESEFNRRLKANIQSVLISCDRGTPTDKAGGYRVLMEGVWRELSQRRYYKIAPMFLPLLLGSTFGKIPLRLVKLPTEGLTILLPVDGFPVIRRDSGRLHSILVAQLTTKHGPLIAVHAAYENAYQHFRMTLDDGTVNETIDSTLRSNEADLNGRSADEVGQEIRTLLTLVFGVAFLAAGHNPELCELDCLSADRLRYLAGRFDENVVKRLHERAIGRGKNGFILACETNLLSKPSSRTSDSDPTGRELRYRHLRGGHFALQRFGVGRTESRVIFRMPTVVRPDKPSPPVAQGFAIR